jgi:hypothetical protein
LKVRVPIKAGPRLVSAAFIRKIAENTNRLRPFLRSTAGTYDSTGRPHVKSLTVTGPFNPTGPGDTPSRRKLLVCRPAGNAEENPCASRIISAVARRAYRRPVTETDLKPLLDSSTSATSSAGFNRAAADTADPEFVFRVEQDPPQSRPGAPYA